MYTDVRYADLLTLRIPELEQEFDRLQRLLEHIKAEKHTLERNIVSQ